MSEVEEIQSRITQWNEGLISFVELLHFLVAIEAARQTARCEADLDRFRRDFDPEAHQS